MAKLPWYVTLLVFLTCWPAAVFSAETMSAKAQNGDSITLHKTACELRSDWFKDWKKAVFLYQGKVYGACWRLSGTQVIVVDSAGDVSNVPVQMFRSDEPV